jgi:hypothetical protein
VRRLALMLVSVCAAGAAAACGCAARSGQIVTDPGDLPEGSGAPHVASISELGGGDIVLTAELPAPSAGDGKVTVGEALWVHGSNFGRRPTVSVAGHPAVVLARTTDGGLVTRVPPGAPVGRQSLVVTTDGGGGEFPVTVRRLVATLAAGGGNLTVVDLAADGPRAAGSVAAPGGLLQVGADGRAAYVLDAASARLAVFELPAQAGPRAAFSLELEAAPGAASGAGARGARAFAAAAHAPALLIVRARDLMILDTTAALRPTRSRPRLLPPELARAGVRRAAFAPDGRSVVVACDDNRLALLDVSRPGGADLRATVEVAPGARVPVIADVTYAPDGRTVWLALGDAPDSQAPGGQPTEIVAVRIASSSSSPAAPLMTVARRVAIDEAVRPARISAGRALPLQSGASIRLPPERATVFLTAAKKTGGAVVFRLGAEDHAAAVLEAPAHVQLGGAELSPDGAWLLAPTADGQGRLGLMAVPADGRSSAGGVLDLGAGGPQPRAPRSPDAPLAPSALLPALAAQP